MTKLKTKNLKELNDIVEVLEKKIKLLEEIANTLVTSKAKDTKTKETNLTCKMTTSLKETRYCPVNENVKVVKCKECKKFFLIEKC